MNTDYSDDPVLAALSVLDVRDVSVARAASLRRRCLAVQSAERVATQRTHQRSGLRRWVVPAFAATWSAIYVFETIRRAMVFYRGS